jgi:hypothetical protein
VRHSKKKRKLLSFEQEEEEEPAVKIRKQTHSKPEKREIEKGSNLEEQLKE